MLVLFVEIAVCSAVVYGRMCMVNLRRRWGRVVCYESSISRVGVEESMFCLLPTSNIIVIMFFYALSCLIITSGLHCCSVFNENCTKPYPTGYNYSGLGCSKDWGMNIMRRTSRIPSRDAALDRFSYLGV